MRWCTPSGDSCVRVQSPASAFQRCSICTAPSAGCIGNEVDAQSEHIHPLVQASPALKTRKWRPATEDMEGREGRSYRFASLRATRVSLTIAPVNGVVSVGAVVLDPRGHRTAVPVASTARCVSLSTSFHPAAPSNTHTREAAPRHAHQLQPRTATESMHHERAGGLVRVQLQSLGETCGEQEDSLRAEALCLRGRVRTKAGRLGSYLSGCGGVLERTSRVRCTHCLSHSAARC
jgi:hypothetical protein